MDPILMPDFVNGDTSLEYRPRRVGGGSKGVHFENIVSVENILESWKEFLRGKRKRHDVQEFSLDLMENIFCLHQDLVQNTYKHGSYQAFRINDPKPRQIHKSAVKDRLLHHAIYRILYPYFDRLFISDSFSCRNNKGTHKALNRFRYFSSKVSRNNTRTCWVLKCDIKKFFDNIGHEILLNILGKYIPDGKIIYLLKEIIDSFHTRPGVGLPLGNLTSQLLVNIYMNEFDQFLKHHLNVKHYIRYADDFVILSNNKQNLIEIIKPIREFLKGFLKLELHPNKVLVKTFNSGVDFLGWVHFPDHRVLRTVTKRRMFRNLRNKINPNEILQSYIGLLSHGNGYKLKEELLKNF